MEAKEFNLSTNVNNLNLSYDDLGQGATPIIFLHGFPFDKSMWAKQLESLKTTHRVIACDIRGFGKSKDEESSLRIDLFSNDLILFMDKLNIEKAIVCGLSMGGFIALNAQKRFPSRFEALILCDTQCIADSHEVKKSRYNTIKDIEENGEEHFNEGFIKSVFHKDSLEHKKELVNELREIVFANSKHIITGGLLALAERTESCSTLHEITIPTLIICGRQDTVTPLAESEFMHKKVIDSTLQIIENAGHVSNLEYANEFNKHLKDFLDTLEDINSKV